MEKNIVIAYLENMYQKLFEIKLNMEKELQQKRNQLENNKKFIDTIENTFENSFESFSPRKSNQEDYDKIKSLTEEQNYLEEEIHRIERKLTEINSNFKEMEAVLNAERENIKYSRLNAESLKKTREHYKKIIKTQDLERQRMAKQLYDKMVQDYDYMIHKIEVCSRLINVDKMGSHKELNQMANYMRNTMQNMLEIVYDIPFFPKKEVDMEDIILKEIEILKNNHIDVSFFTEGKKMELPLELKSAVIKIVKESCDNILSHADAKNVSINLLYEMDEIIIQIEDDGIGFSMDILNKNNIGVGISIMEERIWLLNGKFDILSELEKGSKIIARIPVVS